MFDIQWPEFVTSSGMLPKLKVFALVHGPTILKVLVVVLVGYLITVMIARVVRGMLIRIKLDALAVRFGIQTLLTRAGLSAPSLLLPRIVRTLGFLTTIYLAADIMQIAIVSRAIGSAIAFIPTLITALAIVAAGVLGAEFARKITAKVLASREGLNELASIIPQGVYVCILVLTLAMAAQQLGLNISLVNRIILLTIVGITLGLGGSLGLGAVPFMQQFVGRYHALRLFAIDDMIELHGVHARIVRFAPTVAILEIHTEDVEDVERLFIPYQALITANVVRDREAPVPDFHGHVAE